MTRLSVNINKIATLRNARGGNIPNVKTAAINCELFGADGITVHPRPDERHIRYRDVLEIRPVIKTEFNIEGYPSDKFIDLVIAARPDQVTLVPDAHDAITSNAGWDTQRYRLFLTDVISTFKDEGIRTSIFVDTIISNIENAAYTCPSNITLCTFNENLKVRNCNNPVVLYVKSMFNVDVKIKNSFARNLFILAR